MRVTFAESSSHVVSVVGKNSLILSKSVRQFRSSVESVLPRTRSATLAMSLIHAAWVLKKVTNTNTSMIVSG